MYSIAKSSVLLSIFAKVLSDTFLYEEYFRINPQSEFPADFFDPNQRFNVDSSKTFIKCNGAFPESISSLYSSRQGPYSFDEMLQIINTPEWTS